MRKYLLLSSIIILIIYYFSTLLISFILLSKSVANNDSISLERYINVKQLRNNFYDDIYEYSSSLINLINKKIKIKNESIEFTGELTSAFLEKLFSKISNNISTDFSNPEIILYFYFNSNELISYLNKSFTYFADYNFQKYLLEKQSINSEDVENNKDREENKKNINDTIAKKEKKIISRLINRIKSTDYFFLTSPIHFKIGVKHKDIPFILILRFNGYIWEVQKITIPFKKLIDPKNINLSN